MKGEISIDLLLRYANHFIEVRELTKKTQQNTDFWFDFEMYVVDQLYNKTENDIEFVIDRDDLALLFKITVFLNKPQNATIGS